MHRVWFCDHPDVTAARSKFVDAETISRARADCLNPFWTTGIFAHPSEDRRYTPPCTSEGIELRDASGVLLENFNDIIFNFPVVATDGSLKRTGNSELDRAEWAAVFA